MSSNIKMLIEKSTKEHSIDEMIHYIIHHKIKITLYPENEQYLRGGFNEDSMRVQR